MTFNLQNLRTPFSGQEPEGLLPGQLCFNLPDKVVYVGDGTSTKKDLGGNQTTGLPGQGWFSSSLDPLYFLLNPEKYSSAPVDNQILAYSATLGKPVWKDPAINDRPTQYYLSNQQVIDAPGGNVSEKISSALGVVGVQADTVKVEGSPGDTYVGFYVFQNDIWAFSAQSVFPTSLQIPFNPTGTGVSGVNVQSAIAEISQTKVDLPILPPSPNTVLLWNGLENVWFPFGAFSISIVGVDPILVDNTNPLSPVISVANSSESGKGVVRLASDLEVQEGTDTSKAVTPAGLQSKVSDSTSTASSTTLASSSAVKSAYDLANTADARSSTNQTNIGSLSSLQTSDKSSIVNAINEQETRLDLLANSLIYGGTYNASTALVDSVTQAGTDAGLVVGQPLPTGAVTANVFVIITVEGVGVAPTPVGITLEINNWLVSNGVQWEYLQLGIPATTANLVAFTPSGTLSSTNVQNALEELDTEKTPKTTQVIAGTGLAGGGNLSSNVTLSLNNSGVVPNTYGSDGQIPQIQIDTYGRITSATEIAATLGGLSDVDLTSNLPVDKDLLQYDGPSSDWLPKTLREANITSLNDLNATESNFLFVDAALGDDATGALGDISRPFKTIKAALAVAVAPNMVVVSEGNYTEANPLNIPAGVQVISKCGTLGWVHTLVTPSNLLDDVFVLGGDKSGVTGISVVTPAATNKAAFVYAGGNGTTASVTFVGIQGVSGGSGIGMLCKSAGTGKIISYEVRYQGGDMDAFLQVDGGIIAVESTHIPNTPLGGAPRTVYKVTDSIGATTCRLQCAAANSGNSGVQHVVEVSGGVSVFHGANFFSAANGVHITSNTYDLLISSGLIDCTSSVIVDSGLTGANGRLSIYAQMNDVFSYPYTWQNSDYTFEFTTEKEDPNSESVSKQLHGADMVVGEYHRGNSLTVGYGSSYKYGIKAFTSDSTASSTTDGGNITDITAAVISKSGSTFTFQGTAANHCMYFGTTELDDGGIPLLHTGLDIQTVSGDLVGEYAVEIWTGSAWTQIGVQAVSDQEGYSYSNRLFLRSNSKEKILYGIRPVNTWTLKSIGGSTCYWIRVRITAAPALLPTFETAWLIPKAATSISSEGVLSKLGFSQYGVVNSQGSNIFTEAGTVVNYSFTMGPGGGNSYTHVIENIQIGSPNEGLYWQTALTPGICTALPIFIDVGYSLDSSTTTTAPVFNLYLTPVENSGTLIADPAGSLTPIPRPEALTTPFTGVGSVSPILDTRSLPYVQQNKLHRVRFGPFNLSDYYEGDAIALFLECVSTGTPASAINVWGVAVIGYRWTDGIRGY